MARVSLSGILAPIPTIFHDDGRLNPSGQHELIRSLRKAGLAGVLALGTTGEFSLLTDSERKRLLESCLQEATNRFVVVPNTGAPSTGQSLTLTRHARDSGATIVAVVAPYYVHPEPDGLLAHYRTIHQRVDIPLYAYNMPQYVGYDLPNETILTLASEGTLSGMKDSAGNESKTLGLLAALPNRFAYLTGAFSLLVPCVAHGGAGGVLRLANLCPRTLRRIFAAARAGRLEEARRLQGTLHTLVAATSQGASSAGLKYAVELRWGVHSGLRGPVTPLTAEQRERIRLAYGEAEQALGEL